MTVNRSEDLLQSRWILDLMVTDSARKCCLNHGVRVALTDVCCECLWQYQSTGRTFDQEPVQEFIRRHEWSSTRLSPAVFSDVGYRLLMFISLFFWINYDLCFTTLTFLTLFQISAQTSSNQPGPSALLHGNGSIFNNVWKSLLKRVSWTAALLTVLCVCHCCVLIRYLPRRVDRCRRPPRVTVEKHSRSALAQLFSELFNKAFSAPVFVFAQEYIHWEERRFRRINMIKLLSFH